jgi:hypothetical protein
VAREVSGKLLGRLVPSKEALHAKLRQGLDSSDPLQGVAHAAAGVARAQNSGIARRPPDPDVVAIEQPHAVVVAESCPSRGRGVDP